MQHNIALVFTDANQKGERIAKGKLVDYCIGPSQWRNTQFSLYTRLPWQYRFVHHEAHPTWDEAVAAAEKLEAIQLAFFHGVLRDQNQPASRLTSGRSFMNTLYFLATESSAAGGGLIILILLTAIAIWLIPGLVALARSHHNCVSIWLVTIFLGWSFIGWVIALVWAFSNPSPAQPIVIHNNQAN